MPITLDGREVKIGDRLYSYLYGWGQVSDLIVSDLHLIEMVFSGKNYREYREYLADGRRFRHEINRDLFWDEVTITPPLPPKPKRKVKKWQWVCLADDGSYYLTSGKYHSKNELQLPSKNELPHKNQLIEPYLPSEIEVEE